MRPSLPTLSALFVPVALGMLLLGMAFQSHRSGPRIPQEVVFRDGPQPKPANCNKSMTVYLQAEYRLYQRRLAEGRPPFTPECWRLTQEAVQAYNRVASDTDPSAFALTKLPRHLDDPTR